MSKVELDREILAANRQQTEVIKISEGIRLKRPGIRSRLGVL